MSEPPGKTDFEGFLSHIRGETGDSEEHPPLETLIAYHGGRALRGDRQRVQDHLLRCQRCVELLLDLESLAVRVGDGREPAAPARRAWPLLQSPPRPEAPPRSRRSSAPRLRFAALGGFGLAAVALVAGTFLNRPGASAPPAEIATPTPPVAGASGGAASASPAQIAPSARARVVPVDLRLEDARGHAEFELALFGDGGRELWRGGGFRALAPGVVHAEIPAGFEGSFAIGVWGTDGARRELLATYPLRILPQSPR